ncbi:MAG: DUF4268 domain-containing protein [Methanotrichaceae archaeon]|nr:DUF4268 domain-containing protein [Methanotrichaceae archaeon]
MSKPNEWSLVEIITPERQLLLDYWTAFVDYLHERDSTIKTRTPRPRYYLSISLGRANVGLAAIVYIKNKQIATQLYFQGPYALSYFEQIQGEKAAIENEIGAKLVWDDTRPTTRVIFLFKDNIDIKNTEDWPEQHKWLYEKLEAFHKAFAERVKNLSRDYPPEDTVKFPNENVESVS